MRRAARLVFSALALLSVIFSVSCQSTRAYQHCEIILNLPKGYVERDPKEPLIIEDAGGIPHAFLMSNAEKTDLLLSDSRSVVALTRISHDAAIKDGIVPVGSALDFAKLYRDLSGVEAEVYQHSEIPYYVYTLTSDKGVEFSFMATFYRTPFAYFVVLYVAASDVFSDIDEDFLSYASDVRFGEGE